MNLFVFRVETGTMIQFELDMATESVAQLKLELCRQLAVPQDVQVLLINGGMSLEDSTKVIKYSAGTESNPIFLFSKKSIEAPYPPTASASPHAYTGLPKGRAYPQQESTSSDPAFQHSDESDDDAPTEGYSSYNEFRKRVYSCKRLPPTMETISIRAKLAKEFHEEALRESKCCASLVLDQHLQHQGWQAAIANLEDITVEFKKRMTMVQNYFNEYMLERQSYVDFLSVYKNVLETLEKIPMLPSLLLTECDATTEIMDDGRGGKRKSKSLLEWIEARRDTSSETTMDTLYEACVRGVDFYNVELFDSVNNDVDKALDTVGQDDMKEIIGLSERLFGLNSLIDKTADQVKEQEYSAKSFEQNQNRAGDLGDTSVLPDLCASHKKQLVGMLRIHWLLCDIHKRCMRSKEELCKNLYKRLKWVIHVENLMRKCTDQILANYENVSRMRFSLTVLQQIHVAPEVYFGALVEVVRRKKFSQAFLLWASELACYMLTIYNDEMTRRKEFRLKYEGHFLMGLFPGMGDMPPSFAAQAPSIFDADLPNISVEDLDEIKSTLPEMGDMLTIPDMTNVSNFFMKSMSKNSESEDKVTETCVEEKLVAVVNEMGLASNLDQNLLKPNLTENETYLLPQGIAQLKDLDKGCESETDTEEFEKVQCQSPMDMQFEKDIASPRPGFTDSAIINEVGDKIIIPPKKPPRSFCNKSASDMVQRVLSVSSSHTESFTNITKNTSLESIEEAAVGDSNCYNSHHQRLHHHGACSFVRSKSLSPHTPSSLLLHGHQRDTCEPGVDFVTDEFYIDESLPSSLSIDHQHEQHAAVGEIAQQLSNANDVVALLQDNLQSSRSEQDKLKDLLLNMSTLCRTIFMSLREEMNAIKTKVHAENSMLEMHCKSLSSSWDSLTNEFDLKEKEIHKLNENHQQEIVVFKELLKRNDEELNLLREENSSLDSCLNKVSVENKELANTLSTSTTSYSDRITQMERQIKDLRVDKERAIRDLDRLAREHKSEMDNLRKKFRFMTDRSPSECLDGASSPDSKRMEIEAQLALAESSRVEKILRERKNEYECELQRIRDESTRSNDEKDKIIKSLREKEAMLNQELIKFKKAMMQLSQLEQQQTPSELQETIDTLRKEKHDLERQLASERFHSLTGEMSSSATGIVSRHVSSKYKDIVSQSMSSSMNLNPIRMDTCAVGGTVLIQWKPASKHFIVVQEYGPRHFVHHESVQDLEIAAAAAAASGPDERPYYFIGIVLHKEFCQAKKSENRYNIPKGTKFFRVKILPLTTPDLMHSTSRSLMTTAQTSSMAMDDSVIDSCHSLPNTPTKEEKDQ